MKKAIITISVALALVIALAYLSLQIMNSRTFMFFGELVNRVETNEKVVALTFDDGPSQRTGDILDVLDQLGIKATFFVNGLNLAENPELGQRIVQAGHELGNHTYSHRRMVFKSPGFIKREIEETDRLIREAGYDQMILFRPPNAKKFLLLSYYLHKNDRTTVLWDVEPDSYPEVSSDPLRIVDYAADNSKPGSIILLHAMYRDTSLKAIRPLVEKLRQRGYQFVTVSELLSYQ